MHDDPSRSAPTVLVIGAAGASAGLVVPALVRRGVQVRGLVHTADKVASAKRAGATEALVADVNDVDALTEAAIGVDGVFGVIPAFAEDEAKIGVTMVQAAERAHVRKFVFSSVYHPSLTALSNHRDKQPGEAALYESDLDFTILQPAMFMQQIAGLWQSARERGTVSGGYSADAAMAYVDYADVAEVAAEAFVSDRSSYGTFELSAPGAFSRRDLARLMADSLGRPVTADAVDVETWAASTHLPPGALRDGLITMNRHYDQHGFHGGNSLVLTALLGRPPRTVPQFIAQLSRT